MKKTNVKSRIFSLSILIVALMIVSVICGSTIQLNAYAETYFGTNNLNNISYAKVEESDAVFANK